MGIPGRRANGLGSIHQLKNGKWRWELTFGYEIVQETLEDGTQNSRQKRLSKSGVCRTKGEAQKALASATTDRDRGGLAAPDRVTVGEWLERWFKDHQRHLAETTISSYSHAIEKYLIPGLGNIRLQELRPLDLKHFFAGDSLRELGRTKSIVHFVLSAALEEAVRLEVLHRNVADVVKPGVEPTDRNKKPAQAWTAEEASLFLDYAQAEGLYACFYLMLCLGLRRGEVLGLRWENVELEAGKLRIVETLVVARGKVIKSKPKTKKSRRMLTLPPDVVAVLAAHRERQLLEHAALGLKPERDWVFTSLAGTPIHPDNLKRPLKRVVKKADIRYIRIHDLRHTYASLARRHGVALEVVSRRLGHSRSSFTADVYRHTYEDEMEVAAISLADLLRREGQEPN